MACCAVGYNETGGEGDNWPPILVPPGEEEHHAFDSWAPAAPISPMQKRLLPSLRELA